MKARPDLEALRRRLAATERRFGPQAPAFSFGEDGLDSTLGETLARGALHEVFADSGAADAPAASGFAAAMMVRAAQHVVQPGASLAAKPAREIVWVRQRYGAMEAGALYGPGLLEFGLDPRRLVLVDVKDAADALRAGEEATRCAALGAVLIEVWGRPKALDLTASRRLALAAERSGVTLAMLRASADPAPSAATSRWSVRPASSRVLEADAPGHPRFDVKLLRHRGELAGRSWCVEWDRERGHFSDASPVSRRVAALPSGRPVEADQRRAV